jgi:hypothetical protein
MGENNRDRPVVFLGPTMPSEEAETILPAIYFPPASQGSIISAVQRHSPSAVLLIDGVFQGEPAVRHKEILWALAEGLPVFGAASMGALRAAELWRQGMTGVGLIFRWYRRFALAPDDAVAVLHGPPELGWRPVTVALIDLLLIARRAERLGLVDRDTRYRIERAARTLNFRDRTLTNVIEKSLGQAAEHCAVGTQRRALVRSFVEQKRTDATAALRLVARLESTGALAGGPTSAFVTTNAFLRDLAHSGIDLDPR